MVGERIPGTDHTPERVHYSIDWDAFREYRSTRHPDWSAPDTEQYELPDILRRMVAWHNDGGAFFLAPDEPDATEIDDAEASAWIA